MLDAAKILLLLIAAVFGFRWQLVYLEMPGDALYRALVLEVLRLALVLLPFALVMFKRPVLLSRMYILIIAMWASTFYLIYFCVFLPAGFNFSAVEAIGKDYLKLINLAKTFMFVVLGALSVISLVTLMRVGRNQH